MHKTCLIANQSLFFKMVFILWCIIIVHVNFLLVERTDIDFNRSIIHCPKIFTYIFSPFLICLTPFWSAFLGCIKKNDDTTIIQQIEISRILKYNNFKLVSKFRTGSFIEIIKYSMKISKKLGKALTWSHELFGIIRQLQPWKHIYTYVMWSLRAPLALTLRQCFHFFYKIFDFDQLSCSIKWRERSVQFFWFSPKNR